MNSYHRIGTHLFTLGLVKTYTCVKNLLKLALQMSSSMALVCAACVTLELKTQCKELQVFILYGFLVEQAL